jgi:hypothetical protein
MIFLHSSIIKIPVLDVMTFADVEETRVHGENHRPVASYCQTLPHNVVSSTPRLSGVRTHNVSGDRH